MKQISFQVKILMLFEDNADLTDIWRDNINREEKRRIGRKNYAMIYTDILIWV